ncbi:MAG: hypothetical protein P8125_00305, partial [Gemmatimonadota bacterium]
MGLALAVWSVGTYAGNLAGAEHIASLLARPERSLEARQLGLAWLAYFELAGGRRKAASGRLEEMARIAPGPALEYESLFATMPWLPVAEEQLQDVAMRLERLDPASIPASGNPSVVFSSHDQMHPLVREYQLGLLRARLGQEAAALSHAEAVRALSLPSTAGSLAQDLSRSVRASVHYYAGRPQEALAELEARATRRGGGLVRDAGRDLPHGVSLSLHHAVEAGRDLRAPRRRGDGIRPARRVRGPVGRRRPGPAGTGARVSETPAYQRFFAELKRRHVFRIAAVYGGVGFVIVQAADVFIPALHLPPWIMTAVAL